MKEEYKVENLILVINPGSTSTKIAVFRGDSEVFTTNVQHDPEELKKYSNIADQYDFRYKEVVGKVRENGIKLEQLSAVIGRGGLLRPLDSGTYKVNSKMLDDLKSARFDQHASNLGAIIANEIATQIGVSAYIADPVVVDEMEDIARITGLPEVPKTSKFHALNHKAVGRRAAKDMGKDYFGVNMIIAHLGGGISVAAHRRGRVIDVNEALYGDGPFSPERAGKLPNGAIVEMCFKQGASVDQVKKRLVGGGGFVAHFGTQDSKIIEDKALSGDKHAELVYKAMAYQVAKEIGSCAAVLKGDVDAVVITGGIARGKILTDWITEWVGFIAPVMVYPGENEMTALAEAANRVVNNQEVAKDY